MVKSTKFAIAGAKRKKEILSKFVTHKSKLRPRNFLWQPFETLGHPNRLSLPTSGARSPHHLHQYAKPYTRTLHGRVDVERVLLRERRSRYVYLLASCFTALDVCRVSRALARASSPDSPTLFALLGWSDFPFPFPLWSGRYAYARTGRCDRYPQIV